MNQDAQHPLLQDLVAVLLGEADTATQERIESALLQDVELVALRARLETTLSQVAAARGEAHLSESMRATLRLEAQRRVSPPSSASLLLRSAAAVVVLSTGVWTLVEQFIVPRSAPRLIAEDVVAEARVADRARAHLIERARALSTEMLPTATGVDGARYAEYTSLAEERRLQDAMEVSYSSWAEEHGIAQRGLMEAHTEHLARAGEGESHYSQWWSSLAPEPVEEPVLLDAELQDEAGSGAVDSRADKSGTFGGRGGRARAKLDPQTVTSLAALGYGGGGGGVPSTGGPATPAPSSPGGAVPARVAPPSAASAPTPSGRTAAPAAGGGGAGATTRLGLVVADSKSGTPVLGSQVAPIGGLAPSKGAAPANQPAPYSAPHGGAYRGPGDVTPPSNVRFRAAEKGLALKLERVRAKDMSRGLPAAPEEEAEEMDLFFAYDDGRDSGLVAPDLDLPGVRHVALPPVEDVVEAEFARRVHDCLIPGAIDLRNDHLRWWGENPWELTLADAQATFAADVDSASYARVRRSLQQGSLPPRELVRTEEIVNWFRADLPAPQGEALGLSAELAPSASAGGTDRWLLRVGVRAEEVTAFEREPLDLVVVLDVSGSMERNDRIGLVRRAVESMLARLYPSDTVTVITFNNEARVVVEPTSAGQAGVIQGVVDALSVGGGTDAGQGMKLGYQKAGELVTPGRITRVVLLSDGLANTGTTDQEAILASVQTERDRGVLLNTIGVGMDDGGDAFLEQLADKGDGVCDYVDDERSLERALVDRFTSAMVPVADDVKIQLEFDPGHVVRWRQLGYENRAIADHQFRDDAVDAGEVGSGHQVTALFELELPQGLGADDQPLATARLRWKKPKVGGEANELRSATERELRIHTFDARPSTAAASPAYRRVAIAGRFAELLRRSVHARYDSVERLVADAEALLLEPSLAQDPDTVELVGLIKRAAELGLQGAQEQDRVQRAEDDLHAIEHLVRQAESLPGGMGMDGAMGLGQARRRAQERLRAALLEREQRTREAASWSLDGTELVSTGLQDQ